MTELEITKSKLQIAIDSLQKIIEQGDDGLASPLDDEEESDSYQEGVERGLKMAATEAEGAMLLIEDMDESE